MGDDDVSRIACLIVALALPMAVLPAKDIASDDSQVSKTVFIPIHFVDLEPTIPIDKMYDSYKNEKNPESLAGYMSALGIKRHMLDFGSFNPDKWIDIKKKRMDYWVERSRYKWEILIDQFIKDSLKAAIDYGLNLEEYDKDNNKVPDKMIIFVSSSTKTAVPWYSGSSSLGWDVDINMKTQTISSSIRYPGRSGISPCIPPGWA